LLSKVFGIIVRRFHFWDCECRELGVSFHGLNHFQNEYHSERKGTAILSLAEAARRLDLIDNTFVKGVVVGLGITIHVVGKTLAITERDFERIKRHLQKTTYPMGKGRPRRFAAAAAS
jgi:hypothetical protein